MWWVAGWPSDLSCYDECDIVSYVVDSDVPGVGVMCGAVC